MLDELNQNQPIEKPQCKICNQSNFKRIGHHLKKHKNITPKEYYDKFYRKISEGFCLECETETTFINLNHGYRIFCSRVCMMNNEIVSKKRSITWKEKLKNNPEIKIQIANTLAETRKLNPHITKQQGIKLTLRYKENPEIIEKAKITRKQTYEENPELRTQISNSVKKYAREHPNEIKKRATKAGKSIAITKRNKHAELQKSDSNILYFLYIIEHKEKSIIKIGRSGDPKNRLKSIIDDFGNCKIIHILEGTYNKIQPLESFLHNHFNKYCKVQPSGSGRTEWFDRCILNDVLKVLS